MSQAATPLRFCANLGFLFTEHPFRERFAAAAACAFAGVEFMSPYEYEAGDLAALLAANAQELVLFNLPAGDWVAGERGIACHPDRIGEFDAGLERAIGMATALGCTRLNCLAGLAPAGVGEQSLRATLIRNLRLAAPACARAGIRLLIEPINSRVDMPGFWLDTPAKAMAIIDAVGDDNLGLQFDIYHAEVMGCDLVRQLRECLPRIGHIQIADAPGRHEPGSGGIDYDGLFGLLGELGYGGWIGCEYRPRGRSKDSLGWRERWR